MAINFPASPSTNDTHTEGNNRWVWNGSSWTKLSSNAVTDYVLLSDESTDTTCFPIFATSATGSNTPKTGSNLTFNSNTGVLTSDGFNVADSKKVQLGSSQDLSIYHSGSHSFITNATGNLNITNTGSNTIINSDLLVFQSGDQGETLARFVDDGTCELWFNNSKKIETTNTGINVTGVVVNDGGTFDGDVTFTGASHNGYWEKSNSRFKLSDNGKVVFGDGADLQLYHSGSHSYLQDAGTGIFYVDGSSVRFRNYANSNMMAEFIGDGECNLYHNNSKKLETTSSGAKVTGNLEVTGVLTYEDVTNIDSVGIITARAGVNISGGNLQVGGTNVINSGRALYNVESVKLADSKNLILGSGDDLKIYHSGTHSFISEEGQGALKIKGDDVRFENASGTERLRIASDGDLTHTGADNVEYKMKCGTSSGNNIIAFLNSGGTTRGNITYDSDNNFLFFNVNQAERLRIDSNGRMGLGTNNPNNPLTIHASGNHIFLKDTATNNVLQIRHASGVAEFNSYSLDGNARRDYVFNQYSTEVLRITAAGRVGINENSPDRDLHISNTTPYIRVESTSANQPATLELYHTRGNGSDKWPSSIATDDAALTFNVAAGTNGNPAERLRITSAGLVGVNNTTPEGAGIDVLNTRTTAYSETTDQRSLAHIVARNSSDSSGRFASISLVNGGGTQAEGSLNLVQTGNYTGDLTFKLRTGSGSSDWRERLRIKSGGGFTFQQGNTHYPTDFIGGASNGRNYVRIQAGNTTSGHSSGFKLNHSDGNGVMSMFINHNDDHGHFMNEHQGGDILFYTNESGSSLEKLRITSSGDVGIGYNSPTVKLHVREAASGFSGTYDNRYHILMENDDEAYLGFYVPDNQYAGIRFHDTTGLEGYIDYYFGTDAMHYVSTDHHLFKTAGTERLRIRNDGIIQIGNTENPTNYNVKDIMLGNHSGHHGITILSGTNNGGYIMFSDNNGGGSNAYRGQIEYQHNGDFMRFLTATFERLRIDSSGRVLIGTTSPSTDDADTFCVASSGHTGITIRSGTSSKGKLLFSDATSGGGQWDGYIQYEHANQLMRIGVAEAERLRIDSNGYVGIKLIDPHLYYAKDLVVKCIDQGGLTLRSTGTTDTQYLMFADGTSGNERYRGYIGYAHNTGAAGGEHMQFAAGGTMRMRLDSDGLKFGNDTASTNALDDYEEGSWTPGFENLTVDSGASHGKYLKIGSLCWITCFVKADGAGTSSSAIRITGLPFDRLSGADIYFSPFTTKVDTDQGGFGPVIHGYSYGSDKIIFERQNASETGSNDYLRATHCGDDAGFHCTFVYRTT